MSDSFSKDASKVKVKSTVKTPSNPTYVYGKIDFPNKAPTSEGNESKLKMEVIHKDDLEMRFRLKGLDPSMANGIRRVLIGEVPSVAIETVNIYQNTGVIQDEVLAHRLGMIPFVIDSEAIDYRPKGEPHTDKNSFKFILDTGVIGADDMDAGAMGKSIYARDLKWIPMSDAQKELYADNPPRPVHPDILITKMRPGQEIEIEMFLEKGQGKTHAKWNPVSTASYYFETRLEIDNDALTKAEKQELVEMCPNAMLTLDQKGQVVAKGEVDDTTSRMCAERFKNRVKLVKERDSYVFHIESTGCMKPERLLKDAIKIIREKARGGKESLSQ